MHYQTFFFDYAQTQIEQYASQFITDICGAECSTSLLNEFIHFCMDNYEQLGVHNLGVAQLGLKSWIAQQYEEFTP